MFYFLLQKGYYFKSSQLGKFFQKNLTEILNKFSAKLLKKMAVIHYSHFNLGRIQVFVLYNIVCCTTTAGLIQIKKDIISLTNV